MIHSQQTTESKEVSSLGLNRFSIFLIVVSFLFLTFLVAMLTLVKVLHQKGSLEDSKTMKTYFGGLYSPEKKKQKYALACLLYNDLFLLRRLLFCLVLVFLRQYPTIQVQLCILLSAAMLAYLGWYKPFVEKRHNALIIADEAILLILTTLMLFFDTAGNQPYKTSSLNVQGAFKNYRVGFFGVLMVVIHILIHLTYQVYHMWNSWRTRAAIYVQNQLVNRLKREY